jgi:DNA replication protein DnaC
MTKNTLTNLKSIPKKDILKADYPPKECNCGKLIYAKFIEPVFIDFLNRNMKGTGEYVYSEFCEDCEKIELEKIEQEKIQADIELKKQAEEAKKNELIQRLKEADFMPRHKDILRENLLFPEKISNFDLQENLFLFGGTGTGKTSFAVKRLYKQIKSGKRGLIKIFPEMILELRRAVKNNSDGDLLDYITNFDCLVIDDFGVGRFTDYVMELVYMIIERWYSLKKTGLSITCNKPISYIAEKDDRFSSRIIAMCKLVKFEGKDFRLNKQEAVK